MKYLLTIFICSFFITSLGLSQIDSTRPADKEILVSGGASYPYLPGEFKESWKRGWNSGVSYGYSFPPGTLGYGAVFVSVEVNRFAFDEAGYRAALLAKYSDPVRDQNERKAIQTGYVSARGPVRIITGMVSFKGSFSSTKQTIAPYFLIGVGYANLAVDSIAMGGTSQFTIPEKHESGFAWSFGVGVEVPILESIGMFAQAKSVLGVFDPTRQYFPVSGGILYRLP